MPIRRRTRFTFTPCAVISLPSTTIRPASIGSSRFTQRSSVDFPEPDAPIRQTTSCSATRQVDAAQHLDVPEGLVHALDEQRLAHAIRLRVAADRGATSQSVNRASGIVKATKSNAAATYGV